MALFLEPDAVTAADEHVRGVEPHDAGIDLGHRPVLVPGTVMAPAVLAEHIRVEMHTHLVFRPHGQAVDRFSFPVGQVRSKKNRAGC